MVTMIDPPSGWKYGFPKVYDNPNNLTATKWCLENGYPKHELNSKGECHWMRFIHTEDENEQENVSGRNL